MKRIIILIAILFCCNIFSQTELRPKLVVGIVVDQMKVEYLYRFNNDFSENGFKRLMNNGFTYHNLHINYMPSYTAPGHASIYTGATPSIHGIVGNEWFSRSLNKEIYCTDDSSVKTLGNGSEKEGLMSPKNLQATTITDELRLATNFKGKVIGMSLKDRGAILPAGHFANWAFWYSKTGSFISSSYYGEKLPEWVDEFNNEKRFMTYINDGWNTLKPLETYDESLDDENPYEGKMGDSKAVFPYNLKAMFEKKDAGIIKSTPFGNNILADFAKKAVEKEQLGQDEHTDFLAVSFSSTDYVGHNLGPRSIELQDTYLRLDETIADFLNYLDANVGKNNYLLFLTADHAGAENAKFLRDNKYDVKNIKPSEIEKSLKEYSNKFFGADLVLNYSNFNLFFNKRTIEENNLNLASVKQSFKEFLLTQNYVKRVFTEEEILNNSGNNNFLNLIANGFDVTQNGDLLILEKPGYLEYGDTGTTHGSTYSYDTHIPLIFYGWNIKKGENHDKKSVTEIAPTVAQKIKVAFPNGTESKVLIEVLDGK